MSCFSKHVPLSLVNPEGMRITTMEEYWHAWRRSVEDPEAFWSSVAENFTWRKKHTTTLEWDLQQPSVKWFGGAQLNITENCIDRHLDRRANDTAFIFEPNDPTQQAQTISYKAMASQVNKLANVLKKHGVTKGDRVCIYLPMIPEAIFAMLACARIGAVHSVVFGGFSARSLVDRINDSSCKMVLTADVGFRGTKEIALKETVDHALCECPSVEKVLMLNRADKSTLQPGRDLDWQSEVAGEPGVCHPVACDSEDPLFILYTSGSTGKPKGVVHTCGGYMVYTAYTFQNVFQYNEQDLYWCTADVGWITGHSYIVYGPLLCGATSLIFEGIPSYPTHSRFWQIIDKHRVNIFYTAPTAIRSLQAAGTEHITPYRLSSLKVLGSVGEPINEEAWHWYNDNIGKRRCPIVDTWWQTETGGIMISALAGITPLKPGYAGLPLPGVQPVLVDAEGKELTDTHVEGNLCIRFPWPGMIRTTWGDHERCRQTYFETYPGKYFTGDGCKRDKDGFYRITGRVDDVMNISGHRIGTAEVESAIIDHDCIVETAVVAYPHDIKGQGIYAFCIYTPTEKSQEVIRQEICEIVSQRIGPIAKPDKIQLVSGLPKTRSGKIMRRLLRKIAEGNTNDLGDTSTLLDPEVINEIIEGRQ